MDTKTILSQAKARFSHNQNKEYLKNKYESKLLVAEQGGLWKCTPELITFLDSANSQSIILQDSYGNPVGVKDREKLFYKVRDTFNTVMADWLNELTELEKNR